MFNPLTDHGNNKNFDRKKCYNQLKLMMGRQEQSSVCLQFRYIHITGVWDMNNHVKEIQSAEGGLTWIVIINPNCTLMTLFAVALIRDIMSRLYCPILVSGLSHNCAVRNTS